MHFTACTITSVTDIVFFNFINKLHRYNHYFKNTFLVKWNSLDSQYLIKYLSLKQAAMLGFGSDKT